MTDREWMLPEQAPPTAAPSRVAAGHAAVEQRVAPGSEILPRLAVFDRPLTIADVLDGAFEIVKARPRAVVFFALLFVVPIELVGIAIDPDSYGVGASLLTDPESLFAEDSEQSAGIGNSVFLGMLQALAVPFVAAPIAKLVEGWYLGGDRSAMDCLRRVGAGAWLALLVAWVFVHLIELVAVIGVVLPLVFMALFLVTAPAIVIEGVGPIRGMRRSWRLVKRRFWPILWIGVLSAVVSGTVVAMLPLLPVALVELTGFGGGRYVAAAATVAASLVTQPFVAGAAVLAYFDLRVRTEGLDLQLALAEEFATDAT